MEKHCLPCQSGLTAILLIIKSPSKTRLKSPLIKLKNTCMEGGDKPRGIERICESQPGLFPGATFYIRFQPEPPGSYRQGGSGNRPSATKQKLYRVDYLGKHTQIGLKYIHLIIRIFNNIAEP
ncbi:hypothetical protein MNBD_BACTEROID01-813 [hydrothermal vent metagenome]|uniref:Uncharacterized protein n=1 Tax=hydrothermal vent metagenome TaxID=652676 RepID=A0A3B0U784_9ZZZZ